MTDRWIADLAAQMLEAFPLLGRALSSRLRASSDSEVEPSTMMQIGALMRLKEMPITTSELAKHRKVSLQSASVFVQGLVDRGWIVRVPDPKDRRRLLLKVTPEGEAYAEATQKHLIAVLAELLSNLSQDEIQAAGMFLAALRRLLTANMPSDDGTEP